MPVNRMMRQVLLGTTLLCSLPVTAQIGQSSGSAAGGKDSADALLRLAIPKTMRNREKALAFTYDIAYRNRNYSTQGELLADYTAKYEMVFIEGLPFRKLTEENHRPLTGKSLEQEQKRYDQAFEERSRMSVDEKRSYLRRERNLDIPFQLLPELFTSKVEGMDVVGGRPAVVVDCTPRENLSGDASVADEERQRALRKQVKLWIDRQDLVVSRMEATLLADDAELQKGSTATIEFIRQDGTWLPERTDVQFSTKAGVQVVRGDTEEANSHFQRFRVDVRLLDGGEVASQSRSAN